MTAMRVRQAARLHWPAILLVVLAYVPALIAAPGRMPSDSKLYLYLDPGGFLADAASSFDPGQFAGWVPHQHVSYLWPAGPWFWLFDVAGAPDWIAHRLWIGTLFLVAGLGVRWCAGQLGLRPGAALVAGLVYQVSVYVLPYVSRTSVMLLPWAGLGWVVGFTVRATARRTWGDPAAVALVVLTVGAVNATALAMIVPAPVLWIVHEVWRRTLPWTAALLVALRIAVLSIAVSVWWVAALVIQGRYGAEVLPYSESLADVSLTATAPEVWRGLGYWLFYVRDPYAAATTESLRYLVSTPAILVSFLVPVACLTGLVYVRWVHRRFAALLVVAGGVLAVGVHPIDDRSPLMRLLAGGDDGLALALRSSTRALPVMSLGLALAAGALIATVPRRPIATVPGLRVRHLATGALGLLVLANVPGLWSGAVVDPALERDADPPQAWTDAVAALERGTDGRVLVLPGVEFGAYRWGYTVDQPLPGLTDTPVVTRDLLPLGAPAAMDLLYALDDRFQDGVAEPAAIGPIARLLAADTIWLANDVAFDRFRVARPEVVRDLVRRSPDVAEVAEFGAPTVNVPAVPMIDGRALSDPRVGAPIAPVELIELDVDADLARAYDRTLLVAGSGAGLVDAAAAGLLPPDVGIRYVADDPALDPTVVGQLVTDSNRDRARQWRSSQDTTGYTEPGGPGNGLLEPGVGDARLPVFDTDDPATQTRAEQVGPVTATASAYGEPFAFLPEHRPYRAVDGDPTTAWLVGEHADPVGATLRVDVDDDPATGVRVLQPAGDGRRITEVDVVTLDVRGTVLTRRTVALDERSVTDGQPLDLGVAPALVDRFDITIAAVGGGTPSTAGAVGPVGFAEVDLGLGPTAEIVRPPEPVRNAPSLPTSYLFTRDRIDPLDRWRDDPEPVLVRAWNTEEQRRVEPDYTVRVDARATDEALAALFDWPVTASDRLTGSLRNVGVAAFDADPATAWISPVDDPGGTLLVRGVTEPVGSLTMVQPVLGLSTITELTVASGDEERRIVVAPDTVGRSTATVDPPLPPGDLRISVSGAEPVATVDRRFGDQITLPVAIAEIVIEGAPVVEPLERASTTLDCVEVATLDDRVLRATLSISGTAWLDGAPVDAAPCEPTITLPAGEHLLTGVDGVVRLDRALLDDGLAQVLSVREDRPAVTTIEEGRYGGRYRIDCPVGCWFVYGEGHNDGWTARADGDALGPPVLLDGGFNGWWLPAGTAEVEVSWGLQSAQLAALVISALGALLAILLVLRDRRDPWAPDEPPVDTTPSWSWERTPSSWPGAVLVLVWVVPAVLLAGPSWGLLAAIGGLVSARYRTLPLAGLTALATVLVIGLAVTVLERRDAPFPGGGWPTTFESLHWVGMFAFAALATAAITADD